MRRMIDQRSLLAVSAAVMALAFMPALAGAQSSSSGTGMAGMHAGATTAGAMNSCPAARAGSQGGVDAGNGMMGGMMQGMMGDAGSGGGMMGGMMQGMMGRAGSGGMMGGMMQGMMADAGGQMHPAVSPLSRRTELELTEAQVEKLTAIDAAFLRKAIDARALREKTALDVKDARASGDLKSLETALKAQAEADVTLQMLPARRNAESLELLTAQQRSEWESLRGSMGCGMGQMAGGTGN